jgi:hypothetical protein
MCRQLDDLCALQSGLPRRLCDRQHYRSDDLQSHKPECDVVPSQCHDESHFPVFKSEQVLRGQDNYHARWLPKLDVCHSNHVHGYDLRSSHLDCSFCAKSSADDRLRSMWSGHLFTFKRSRELAVFTDHTEHYGANDNAVINSAQLNRNLPRRDTECELH